MKQFGEKSMNKFLSILLILFFTFTAFAENIYHSEKTGFIGDVEMRASLSQGKNTKASGKYSQATGQNTISSNDLSYVWSGQATSESPYGSNGEGTYSIDPINGIQGFWIGETNLYDHIINVAGVNDQYATKTWTSNNFLSLDEGGTVHGSITLDVESDAELTAGTIYANNISIDDIMEVNYGSYNGTIGIYVDTDVDADLTANRISLSDNVVDIGYDDGYDKGYIELNTERIYGWSNIVESALSTASNTFATTNWVTNWVSSIFATTNWVTNNFVAKDWASTNFLSTVTGGTVEATVNIGSNEKHITLDKGRASILAGSLKNEGSLGNQTIAVGADNSISTHSSGAIGQYVTIDSYGSGGCFGVGSSVGIKGNYAFAVGNHVGATGVCAIALGCNANATTNNVFIWGSDKLGDNKPNYVDHGENTFNIYPTYSINGFYIGNTSFKDCIKPRVSLLKCTANDTYKIPSQKDGQKVVNYYIDIPSGVAPKIEFSRARIFGEWFNSRIELYNISYKFTTTGSEFKLGTNVVSDLSVLNKPINLTCYYDKPNTNWLITSNIDGLPPIVYHPNPDDTWEFITNSTVTNLYQDNWE